MKKLLVILALALVPAMASASIDANLYYGLRNNADVRELQEFLASRNYLSYPPTGNFLSLTLKAVKQYQADNNIPSTGYVGMLTRASVNGQLAADLSGSDAQALAETGSVPQASPKAAVDPPQQPAAQQQAPAPAAVVPAAPQPAPLAFTDPPRLVFSSGNLSSITWQTNRPSKLVTSPILPDASGWTTSHGAWESCGRANVSRDIDSTCLIRVSDAQGNTAEYSIAVFKDSVDL